MFAHVCQRRMEASQWIQTQSEWNRELQREHIHTQQLLLQQTEDHKRAREEQQRAVDSVTALERAAIKTLKDQLTNQSSQSALNTEKLNGQVVELTSRIAQLTIDARVSEHAAVAAVRSSVFHHNLFDQLMECINNNNHNDDNHNHNHNNDDHKHNHHHSNALNTTLPLLLNDSSTSGLNVMLRDLCLRLPALCSEDLPHGTTFRIGYYQHNDNHHRSNHSHNHHNVTNFSYKHSETAKTPFAPSMTNATTTTDQSAQTGTDNDDEEWTWHTSAHAPPAAGVDVDIFSSLDAGDSPLHTLSYPSHHLDPLDASQTCHSNSKCNHLRQLSHQSTYFLLHSNNSILTLTIHHRFNNTL